MITEKEAFHHAVIVGRRSPYAKSSRGVVLFDRHQGIVAEGFNHPPAPFSCSGSETCRAHCNQICMHAETAALRGLRGRDSRGLEMLHVKVVDGVAVPSGPPSCWQCSREVLEAGISAFWLLHETGLRSYPTDEFHLRTLLHCDLPVTCEQWSRSLVDVLLEHLESTFTAVLPATPRAFVAFLKKAPAVEVLAEVLRDPDHLVRILEEAPTSLLPALAVALRGHRDLNARRCLEKMATGDDFVGRVVDEVLRVQRS